MKRANISLLGGAVVLIALLGWFLSGSFDAPIISEGPTIPSVVHTPCPEWVQDNAQVLTHNIECGYYTTPGSKESYELPFVVFRLIKTEETPSVPLLYLQGGPGQSLRLRQGQSLRDWQDWLAVTELKRDLVLFDPRGVSQPSQYACKAFDSDTAWLLRRDVALEEEYQRGFQQLSQCLNGRGQALQDFGTLANAEDALGMMQHLGYERFSVFGVSYGTRLASAIAQKAPERVSHLILDSVYPPNDNSESQWPYRLRHAFNRFFQACTSYGQCLLDEAVFWRAVAHLDKQPLTVEVSLWDEPGVLPVVINADRLIGIVFFAFYDQYFYAMLNDIIQDVLVLSGDTPPGMLLMEHHLTPSGRLKQLVEVYTNSQLDTGFNNWVFFTTQCLDNALTNEAQFLEFANEDKRWASRVVFHGNQDICALMQQRLQSQGERTLFTQEGVIKAFHDEADAPISVPTLMLNGVFDPITPIEEAANATAYFSTVALVAVPLMGHSVVSSSLCPESLIEPFLSSSSPIADLHTLQKEAKTLSDMDPSVYFDMQPESVIAANDAFCRLFKKAFHNNGEKKH
ncbi:alpha/beta fold hydrolase [Marinibactrum halimedae]|uniref:Alpha/beta hydrolase n=1 Tax=Marinibactrum halimedae TaxID=1444977 RepID=A0AA37TDJ1_9GAMM|nr:alpha/beta hydrolase [Marinibactrum halimedae]MCD9460604.1 alpha/beta hydrolase [Marinibactrum halimedae]GLS27820.1 alpha/beta hydrolase [Marinibactrum halimedae]